MQMICKSLELELIQQPKNCTVISTWFRGFQELEDETHKE